MCNQHDPLSEAHQSVMINSLMDADSSLHQDRKDKCLSNYWSLHVQAPLDCKSAVAERNLAPNGYPESGV